MAVHGEFPRSAGLSGAERPGAGRPVGEEPSVAAAARVAHFKCEAQGPGGLARPGLEVAVAALGQVQQLAVPAEIAVAQLRVTVEPQPLDHQPLEVTGQEIGDEESARLGGHHLGQFLGPGKGLVTVIAEDAFHPLFAQHLVQQAAGAAITVEHQDLPVAAPTRRPDLQPHRLGDGLGRVVQMRRQAFDPHVMPAVLPHQRNDLLGDGAATDQQGAGRFRHRHHGFA